MKSKAQVMRRRKNPQVTASSQNRTRISRDDGAVLVYLSSRYFMPGFEGRIRKNGVPTTRITSRTATLRIYTGVYVCVCLYKGNYLNVWVNGRYTCPLSSGIDRVRIPQLRRCQRRRKQPRCVPAPPSNCIYVT